MCKSVAEILEGVYAVPDVLRARRALESQVSLFALVESTGYPAQRGFIDLAQLAGGMARRRSIVETWLGYSAEKEACWGWFFEREGTGSYRVGLKSGYSEQNRYGMEDAWEACAHFIRQELDAITGAAGRPG